MEKYCKKCGSELILKKTKKYTPTQLSATEYDSETGRHILYFVDDSMECPNRKHFWDGHTSTNNMYKEYEQVEAK